MQEDSRKTWPHSGSKAPLETVLWLNLPLNFMRNSMRAGLVLVVAVIAISVLAQPVVRNPPTSTGGSGGIPTQSGSGTNPTLINVTIAGTFTNRTILQRHYDPTNATDKDFREVYSDYYSATNAFGGMRGKSTSSTSDLIIGGNPDFASPESVYISTGPRGWLNQANQWRFTGTGSPRVRGDFTPVLDRTNDIGSASLRIRDFHLAEKLYMDENGFGVTLSGGSADPELLIAAAKGSAYFRYQFGWYRKIIDSIGGNNARGWELQSDSTTFVARNGGVWTNGIAYQTTTFLGTIVAATNTANYTITTNDFVINTYYTNSAQRAWVSATINMTNVAAADFSRTSLYIDQNGDGAFERTGISSALSVALSGGSQQLSAFIQPSGRFMFTNLSSGNAEASIAVNSSEWVKQ